MVAERLIAAHAKPGAISGAVPVVLLRASLALIALAWALPFLQPVHRLPVASFYSEWLALVLGLAACGLLALRRSWASAEVPAVALAPLALAVVVLAQAGFGRVPYAGQAVTAALYLAWAALLIVTAAMLRRELGLTIVVAALAWATIAGATCGALAGVLQHFEISTILDTVVLRKTGAAVFGNVAQANHFAAHLALGLLSAAYLWATGRLHGIPAVMIGAVLLLMLGVSGSRSAWVYLGMAGVLAGLLRARRDDPAARRLFIALVAMLPAFALAQWIATLAPMQSPLGVQTVAQKLFAGGAGITDRLQLWREALWMFAQAPLFGVGWGQFAWYHYEYHGVFGASVALGPFHHAHNILLHLLAETGIAGTACVVAGAMAWLRGMDVRPTDAGAWWLLALLGVLGTHSMLEYPLWYAYFLGIAAVALGLGATRNAAWAHGAGRPAAMVCLVVGAVHLATALPAYRDLERFFMQPSETLTEAELQSIIARARADILLEPYADVALSYGIEISTDHLDDKRHTVERATRFMPADVLVYQRALLGALSGDAAGSEAAMRHAMRVYPGEIPGVLGRLEGLVQRYPRAFEPLLELASREARTRYVPPPLRGTAP